MSFKELSSNTLDAFNKLTDYLARRDHSDQELKTKLKRRFTSEAIESALEMAKENNWLKDPSDLAEMVARQLSQKGKGPLYINGYLRKKGLPPVSFDDEEVLKSCQETLEQKYPDWQTMSFEEKQKPIRFLLQRGFPERFVFEITSGSSS